MVNVLQNRADSFNLTTIAVQSLLLITVTLWLAKVNSILPEPYLDEVFHVRQAQAYWKHQWHVWDPKITTPPGLYLISYVFLSVVQFGQNFPYDAQALRILNAILFCLVVPYQVRRLLQLHWCQPRSDEDTQLGRTTEVGHESSPLYLREINHTVLNICLFPPLFFFSVLYYTDVLSASCVLATYIVFLQRRQTTDAPPKGQNLVHKSNGPVSWLRAWSRAGSSAQKPWLTEIGLCVLGLYALLFRQTNIFWVAIFTAGLKIIRIVKRNCTTSWEGKETSFSGIITESWYHGKIYDPLVREACLEDYIKTTISLAIGTAANINDVRVSIVPYLLFLTIFGAFVLWNGGVVLGHKEFHTASIHLPQMLYIWPNVMFFSFPLIYPYLLNAIVPQTLLPNVLHFGSTRHRLPRPFVVIVILALMTLAVHYNTIVHPFTLADNRHYVFYVFRILLRHPSIKYLAVPVYFVCAWGAIQALGGIPDRDGMASPLSPNQTPNKATGNNNRCGNKAAKSARSSHSTQPSSRNSRNSNVMTSTTSSRSTHPNTPNDQTSRTSFILIHLLSTTLSLITAPLVEPRYFIVPWLIWRLHVPVIHSSPLPPLADTPQNNQLTTTVVTNPPTYLDNIRDIAYRKHDHRLWLETVWFLLVNGATCYVFLYWGFEWKVEGERGRVQRFLW